MSKHTPGPWSHRNGRVFQTDRDVLTIANAARAADGGYCPANGDLIAAAPELLKALEETRKDLVVLRGNITDAAKACSRWDGVPELIDAWIRRNDAAITKARSDA